MSSRSSTMVQDEPTHPPLPRPRVPAGFCSMDHSYLTASSLNGSSPIFAGTHFAHLQTLSVSFFCQAEDRRASVTAHERRHGDSISGDGNSNRHSQTARDIRGRHHVPTRDIGASVVEFSSSCPCSSCWPAVQCISLKSLSTSIQRSDPPPLSTLLEEVISASASSSPSSSPAGKSTHRAQVGTPLSLTMRRAGIMAVFIPVISLLTFLLLRQPRLMVRRTSGDRWHDLAW